METINSLISILAVIISFIALVRGRKTAQKLIDLEEVHAKLSQKQLEDFDRKEKESLKANLVVTLHSKESPGKIIIENRGPAVAKNIKFSFTEEGTHNPLVGGDFEEKILYPLLNPNESYYFLANFPLNVTQKIYSIDLSWYTEDGTQYQKTFKVSK